MRLATATVLVGAATAFVLGCPSKRTDATATTVGAPAITSASEVATPRVKVEVFAVRAGAGDNTSLEVATKLTYTPTRCDSAKYLQPAGSAGPRRRMVLFRVKDVSLVGSGPPLPSIQGKTSEDDDGFGNQEGERAIVIDCVNDAPDARPFPFFFTFAPPAGFDAKRAMIALEGQRVPLAPFVKEP